MMTGEYETYDIDVEEEGRDMHNALKAMTGRMTVPNVFVGGENIGGDMETEAEARNG